MNTNVNRHDVVAVMANTLGNVGLLFRLLADQKLGYEYELVKRYHNQERDVNREDCVHMLESYVVFQAVLPKVMDEVNVTVRLFLSHYKVLGFVPEVAICSETLTRYSEMLIDAAAHFSEKVDHSKLTPEFQKEVLSRGFRGAYSPEDDFAQEVEICFSKCATALSKKHPELLRIYLRMQLKAFNSDEDPPTKQTVVDAYRERCRIPTAIEDTTLTKLLENHASKHWKWPKST